MPNYGDPKYWEKRYKNQEGTFFDWLENYSSLKPLFDRLLNKSDKILNVGCGNSQISEEMYDDGYSFIWNTDISETVISQMHEQNESIRPGMIWEVDDALNMKYPDEMFDVIIDKSSSAD